MLTQRGLGWSEVGEVAVVEAQGPVDLLEDVDVVGRHETRHPALGAGAADVAQGVDRLGPSPVRR